MRHLDVLKQWVEWSISGLCLVGSAALFVQQDWLMAVAIFTIGLGFSPAFKTNIIIQCCLTLMAFIVIFSHS